jgi:predicted RNA-binding Zn ribbon-like protein
MIDIREHDTTAPAPGDLELLQRFLNLHDHDATGSTTDPPSEMVRAFLVERGLLSRKERFTPADRETALALAEALRALVRTNLGEPLPDDLAARMDDVSEAAGLHPHFVYGDPVLVPSDGGLPGALGRLVAIAFLARFDGTWEHLKICASEDCRSVFYDRSKNGSGRWCSMDSCGNRAKVRAWRERQRSTTT